MRGLVDAGPTPSGHRTPNVIVSLPLLGLDEPTVTPGGWMVQQALAQGVHCVHFARDPEGVKRFVQSARYPIHKQAIDAGDMVRAPTKEWALFFLDKLLRDSAARQVNQGVMTNAGRREDSAEVGGSTVGGRCLGSGAT